MTPTITERRRKAADTLVRLSALANVPEAERIYNADTHQIDLNRVQDWTWSSGEEVLINTLLFCLDIGQNAPTLRDVFYRLDDHNRNVVIETLRILNGYEPVSS
jgi:hypothetical protein